MEHFLDASRNKTGGNKIRQPRCVAAELFEASRSRPGRILCPTRRQETTIRRPNPNPPPTDLLSAPDFGLGSESDPERCAHLEAFLGLLPEVVVQLPGHTFKQDWGEERSRSASGGRNRGREGETSRKGRREGNIEGRWLGGVRVCVCAIMRIVAESKNRASQ